MSEAKGLELVSRGVSDYIKKHYPQIEISMSSRNKKARRKRYYATEHPLLEQIEEEYYKSLKVKKEEK